MHTQAGLPKARGQDAGFAGLVNHRPHKNEFHALLLVASPI